MTKISVVILTLNSKDFLKDCLDSVFRQIPQGLEVIVVDNGSEDGTPDLVRRYPSVILIENGSNLGASRGKNQGLQASSGEWILILDCDTTLEKDFLSQILKTIEGLPPETGILQPKILNPDRKTVYSCGIYLSRLRRFYDIGRGQKDSGQFDNSKYIFGGCTACVVYNRKMLQDIKEDTGYFDERFFFLVEDVDLSWRAQRKGWKTIFCPQARCYHCGNSSGLDQRLRQYLCFRNRYYAIVKNEGIGNYSKKFFPLLFYDFPRLFCLFLINPYLRRKNEAKNGVSACYRQ